MMRWRVLIALLTLYVLLVIAGGLVFHTLEQTNEAELMVMTQDYLQRILDERPCLSAEDVRLLILTVIRAYDQGIITTHNDTSSASNWDMASSIFFAGTVGTTIGYGHIAPSTSGGRIFCVFYALISIPLCLTLLMGIAGKMTKFLHDSEEPEKPRRLGKSVRTLLFTTVGIVVFLLGPAGVFLAIEGWTYGDSVYYAFITLTTIGFGDFVAGVNPEQEYRATYRLLTWLWIIIGLAWLSTVISLFQDLVQTAITKVDQKVEDKLLKRGEKSQEPDVTDLRIISEEKDETAAGS